MKATTPAVVDLLANSQTVHMVELLTLTLRDSTVYRWSCGDVPVSYGSNEWSLGPIVERDGYSVGVGLDVSTHELSLHADDAVTVLGLPLLQAARQGVLDGAQMLLQKAISASPADPVLGLVHLAEGRVGDVEVNGITAKLSVRGFMELLDTQVPVDVYQPGCLNTVYSTKCGLSKAANGLGLSVQAGSTRTLLKCGAPAGDQYRLGEVLFTSGLNSGLRRTVKVQASGELQLSFPLPEVPAVGDGFTVYKGCDRTTTTCANRFANLARFRGQPYVPQPETAV